MGIKSDNAKSIFHGRVMQMGAHRQHFPEEAGHSLHWEEALWKWNKAFQGGSGVGCSPCYRAAYFHAQR